MEKTNKKFLHFKMLTLQNVKLMMSEYSNPTVIFTETLLDNYAVKDQLQTSAGFP